MATPGAEYAVYDCLVIYVLMFFCGHLYVKNHYALNAN